MKEILKANLNNARNAEHYQFHSDVLSIVTAEVATAQKIDGLRSDYVALFDKENAAFIQNRAYESTKEIEAKDRERDDLFLYIKQTVDSNLHCPVATKKAAAEKLAFAMKPYRSANSKAFAENTAQVTNLVLDLQSEAYAGYVQLLGLTEAVAQLQAANDEFNAIYMGRSGEKLVRASSENMKSIRPKVDAAYRTLASAINALYQVNSLITRSANTETELGGVIDGVNALIVQLHQTLSLRGAGSAVEVNVDDNVSPDGGNTPSGGDNPPAGGGSDNGSDDGGDNDGAGTGTEAEQIFIGTSVNDSAMGSVSGMGTYDKGTTVTLTATANAGYRFVSWSDDVTDNPRQVVAEVNGVAYSAIFEAIA